MQKGVFDTLPAPPFARLRALLDGVTPRLAPVSLALGEPQHAPPALALQPLKEKLNDYGRYPPIGGTLDWKAAVRSWLLRRFEVEDVLAEDTQILPLNGTREGLFLAAQIAPFKDDGLMAMPDPFYQVYASAAVAAGAQPHYITATRDSGFIAPLVGLGADELARLRALYLCNPTNPQGAVSDKAYLEKALELAQRHNFLLMVDECYAEIYDPNGMPPPSILEIMQENNVPDAPVLAFHSLSKRSNLPGLRSGFVAGGASAMRALSDLRQIVGPQCPTPAQAAAALAWSEDAHVVENRLLYDKKMALAEKIFGEAYDFKRPAAGFFLWLNVANGEAAAEHLWREKGVRVLPGAYLSALENAPHAAPYIRVALVADMAQTEPALLRLKTGLDDFSAKAKESVA
ncbi:MAG TPA: aspartate aminotransferase [Rhodobiaceae bacterium]|nr:aspartate aminotransferase [Rhodobiaceae bacterium]|tara:strand:+ start:380 stop:1585 length:1206 start_codon:yes stop_codon:yes gene_type:complete